MSKRATKRQVENLGKAVAKALLDGGVITLDQMKNTHIIVDGHKKHLRTEPRKPTNNKKWKRHCHHPLPKH